MHIAERRRDGVWLLAPMTIFLLLLLGFPLVLDLIYSVSKVGFETLRSPEIIGLGNYREGSRRPGILGGGVVLLALRDHRRDSPGPPRPRPRDLPRAAPRCPTVADGDPHAADDGRPGPGRPDVPPHPPRIRRRGPLLPLPLERRLAFFPRSAHRVPHAGDHRDPAVDAVRPPHPLHCLCGDPEVHPRGCGA